MACPIYQWHFTGDASTLHDLIYSLSVALNQRNPKVKIVYDVETKRSNIIRSMENVYGLK